MSDLSRTRLFWRGTKGRNAARVAEKQAQDRLNAEMARERVMARYQELKQNAERRGDQPGTQAERQDAVGRRTGEAS